MVCGVQSAHSFKDAGENLPQTYRENPGLSPLHPAYRLMPRPPDEPSPAPLRACPAHPGRVSSFKPRPPRPARCLDPAHHTPRPRPRLKPVVAEGLFRALGSPSSSGGPGLSAASALARRRRLGLPRSRTWYGRAVGAVGSCSPGRAFQIVSDLHGDGGAAAEEPPYTAGERGRGTGKLQPGESSGAERAPWVCTQGGDGPGLEKDTGAFLTCQSSPGLQSRGDSPRTGARIAISAPASRTAVHLMPSRLCSHRCGRASNCGGRRDGRSKGTLLALQEDRSLNVYSCTNTREKGRH